MIEEREKWGSITFLILDVVKRARELNGNEFNGLVFKVSFFGVIFGVDRVFLFFVVKVKLFWLRRFSKGFVYVKCDVYDVGLLILDFFNLRLGERYIRCEVSIKYLDFVVIRGIDKDVFEFEILSVLRNVTDRKILDFFLVRGDVVENSLCYFCEEVLFREIFIFMFKGSF